MARQGNESNNRIVFNVGGKLFETTIATILSGAVDANDSLLARAARLNLNRPIFIDRDPDLFSTLLSLLRSRRLPSAARRRYSNKQLLEEARFYGLEVESLLRSALSPPPFLAFGASLLTTLVPAAEAFPSSISAGQDDGSLWIAHGGQISSYDWSLTHVSTVRTHVDNITSLRRAAPQIAALGSMDEPGLHFYNVFTGRHVGSSHWSDPGDLRLYKAQVTAIASPAAGNDPVIYAAFESHHRENCIIAVDRERMEAAAVIGRQSGAAVKTAAAGKVTHVQELGLVFTSTVTAGAFGYAGYIRLWDTRSGMVVWESCEPGGGLGNRRFDDALADADVDGEGMKIYKVCWNSGDIGVVDIRRLGQADTWTYLEDRSVLHGPRKVGAGEESVLHCYKRGQVLVGKKEGLEVWSMISDGQSKEGANDGSNVSGKGYTYRRNYVDKEEEAKKGMVRMMEGGGERLFVSRQGMEGVEVWESSTLSGAVSLLQ